MVRQAAIQIFSVFEWFHMLVNWTIQKMNFKMFDIQMVVDLQTNIQIQVQFSNGDLNTGLISPGIQMTFKYQTI